MDVEALKLEKIFLNRYSFGILDSEEMVKKYAKSADQKVVALIQKWLANRYSEF